MRQGTREVRREGNGNKTEISPKRDQWSRVEKRLIERGGGGGKRIKLGCRRRRKREEWRAEGELE